MILILKVYFSNYTDKWNTNIGIYIYVYEINRSNCRVKSNGYNYCRNGINRYGEISKSIYIQRKRITSLVIKKYGYPSIYESWILVVTGEPRMKHEVDLNFF